MNNSEINFDSGVQLSFYQLFNNTKLKVEIPIIQRDYAQGRKNVKEVRDAFLQSLHTYLEQGEPFRDLDFVYGSITKNKINGLLYFTPLDGQQRLTTLFLLHWYLAQIAGENESFRKVLSSNGSSLFTYETRTSSKEFCNALIANDLDEIREITEYDQITVSEAIKDQSWFYLSWEHDPTICSMLTMLDAIHTKFFSNRDFFKKLVDLDRPVITFRFLNLSEFKLTDDLYIKMNARGKPLTDFENFKAHLEKFIKSFSEGWPEYRLDFKKGVITGYEYFIHKIDTDWADLFWNYRNIASQDEIYDDEIMNLIRLKIANHLLIDEKERKDNLYSMLFKGGYVLPHIITHKYSKFQILELIPV